MTNMSETDDQSHALSAPHALERCSGPALADVAAALLPLHAAKDRHALADAVAALTVPLDEDSAACVFLDDGSGTLIPFVNGDESPSGMRSIPVAATQTGPLSHVFATGETVVLDSLADLVGEQVPELPARRILLLPLQWEEEKLGIVLFFDQGRTSVELYPQLAEHIGLALVRLRALDQKFRFGGIDPSHWLFDREWLRLRVEEEVERAQRYGHPLTLLLFLFENLDDISKTVGRHQTEVFLRRVAAVIRGQIRSPDVLAGYGRASVAVLMPETPKAAAVVSQLRVASRLLKMKLMSQESCPTPVLLIAAATCPEDAQTGPDLVDVAEARLTQYEEETHLQESA
jgi:diguanylate cyclase (GGDEF)-like protein